MILVETVAADNVTVGGTLTNQGTIRKAQAVSGAGLKTFGLTGVQVNVGTQGTLAQIQVDRVDSNHANASTPLQTGRYWTITGTDAGNAAATGFTVALTLPHNNLTAPKACRYPGGLGGSGWDCDDGTNTTSTTSTVTRSAVTGFSDWAVGSNAGPTSVTLRQLTAQGSQSPIIPILALLAALVLAGVGWLIIGQRMRRPAAAAVRSDPRE